MRRRTAVAGAVTTGLVLAGVVGAVGLVGLRGSSEVDGRRVTFRGTAEAGSMSPTIEVGDRVVATEVDGSGPEVGDVVVYRNPGRWLASRPEGEGVLVHRVLGRPGDTVVCCDPEGRLAVNGRSIDETYLAPTQDACNAMLVLSPQPGSPLRGACDWEVGPIPDGQLFVLGDHRSSSADSRFHLCPPDAPSCTESPWVPIDRVRGVVVLP